MIDVEGCKGELGGVVQSIMSVPESSPEMTRWCALAIAVVASIVAVSSVISLEEEERTGVALYRNDPRMPMTEQVRRGESPAEFSQAIELSELHAMGAVVLMAGGIWFYRKLSS
jgi:hypothetical protein